MAEPLRFQTPVRSQPPGPDRTSRLPVNGVDLQQVRQDLARWVPPPPSAPAWVAPEPFRQGLPSGIPHAPAPEPVRQKPGAESSQRGLSYLLSELVGMVPLLAPLGAAGWYQADLAHEVFGWQYPLALIWPAAIEGGAAYAASLYLRKLVAGHSTISTRIGMLVYAAGSSALLWWHAIDGGKPWQAAAGIGGMTLAAVWIWTQRSRWLKRKDLQERGLVDTQAPRFSLLRWVMCPIETPRAFRYAVKHGIPDPAIALEAYRRERNRGRIARALERARRRAEQRRARNRQNPHLEVQAEPEPRPEPEPERETRREPESKPKPERQPEPDRKPQPESALEREPETRPEHADPEPGGPEPTTSRRRRTGTDTADLGTLAEVYGEESPPSLKKIMTALGCGVPKAQRLQSEFRKRIGAAE